MTDEQNPASGIILKLIICLVIFTSATVVVIIYHCIIARYMGRRIPPEAQQEASMDNSMAGLLPAHKYRAGVGLMGADGGTCAICLCEFEEGEELRTLPECIHSFHVACIDMWLYSHDNCPMCRSCIGLYSPTLINFLHHSNTTPPEYSL